MSRWSTIAAQLPGRTDNEIKNYWNTHLKKRLLRMGINPETYAPSSSPTSVPSDSTVGAGGGPSSAAAAAAPSSSTTRHMAQWESARLEAEARHSRESALFSTSGAAASPGHSGASGPAKLDADFFLRMWNSEVGEAFRSKEATSGVSPASSSTKCSCNSAQLTVAVKKEELEDGKLSGGSGAGGGSSVSSGEGHDPNKEDVECKSSVSGRAGGGGGGGGNTADSSSSNEVEEATSEEETYQMYLNFMGEDMAQLGHLFQGGLDSISLFGGDLNEASLDMAAAFK